MIGVLAILLAIFLLAMNPFRQFSHADNLKRASDVVTILSAVHQYADDNKGMLPASITTTEQSIGNTGADICSAIVPTYIRTLPVDPFVNMGTSIATCSGSYVTNYTIVKSVTDNHVTVRAPAAAQGVTISVTW